MSDLPVELSWEENGVTKTEKFALLVVACDPRGINIPVRTPLEKEVTQKLSSSTFYTSLFEVERDSKAKYATRFNPSVLKDLGPDHDYDMCGFRDEVQAHCFDWPEPEPEPGTEYEAPGRANNKSLMTCYHLRYGPFITPEDQAKYTPRMWEKSNENLLRNKLHWVDFNVPTKPDNPNEVHYIQRLVEDYFPHFNSQDLADGLPWKILKEQGNNHTIYVASFTCFESVLHIYEYAQMLMQLDNVKKALPADKNAPIAVVGGGPSGLLFYTQMLGSRGLGYTNIKLLEARDFLGGKSRTVQRISPGNDSVLVPCELGTCYLSAGYTKLLPLIDYYQAGTPLNLEGCSVAPPLRSVIDEELAQTEDEKVNGIEFQMWCLRLAAKHTKGFTPDKAVTPAKGDSTGTKDSVPVVQRYGKTTALVQFQVVLGVAASTIKFGKLHKQIMGDHHPMPTSPIDVEKFKKGVKADNAIFDWNMTFLDYLQRNEMMNLLGPLTYAYSLQGYGAIDRIPAYYGLVWITPKVLNGAVFNTVWLHIPKFWQDRIKGLTGFNPDANLTGIYKMERGWSEFWNRIIHKENLKKHTVFNAKNVTVVRRQGVAA